MKRRIPFFFIPFILSMLSSFSVIGQGFSTDFDMGPYTMQLSGLPGQGQGCSSGANVTVSCSNTTGGCGDMANILANTSISDYLVAQQNQDYSVLFQYSHDGSVTSSSRFVIQLVRNAATIDEEVIDVQEYFTLGVQGTPFTSNIFLFNFTPTQGSIGDVIRCYLINLQTNQIDNIALIPLIVEGSLNQQVPVTDTILTPQLPYMILHDPPGDGSFSEFQETTSFCREFGSTYSSAVDFNAQYGVKIGAAGDIGFIATVPFEFYVQFNASFGIETTNSSSGSYQQCIETTTGFNTSSLDSSIGDGADVFIGYGETRYYGITDEVVYSNCGVEIVEGLVYYSDPMAASAFVKTENGILADIAIQQGIVDDTSLSDLVRTRAQNQIDVWNQVLDLNNQNKANASTGVPIASNQSFDGGGSLQFNETALTTTQVTTIETEMAISGGFGIETVVEVGGSGVNSNLETTFTTTMGQSVSQTGADTKVVKYTLIDDDLGDNFFYDVYQDPVFGTPIFELKSNSDTSCPYEGGYRRDQPDLSIDANGCTSLEHLYVDNIPLNSAAVFDLNYCNNSNETREYFLKLENNTQGAVVKVAGTILNSTNGIVSFTVPANSCLNPKPTITIEKDAANPNTVYNDMILELYPDCNEDEAVSISLNVTFGGSGGYGNQSCNTDCTLGNIEIWNPSTCQCDIVTTTIYGCTDINACNYDGTATCDDGSCVFVSGCTDSAACNYDPNADCDDGSCGYIGGCTDPSACNYNPNAICDDGSCTIGIASCNTDCSIGHVEYWDASTCSCKPVINTNPTTVFPASIALNTLDANTGFTIVGKSIGDRLGRAVGSAGDINGDGLNDFIVGAYIANSNDNGESYVIFGTSNGFPVTLDVNTLNGMNGFTITGAAANDQLGLAVNTIGDVNSDGLDDLIVSAYQADFNGANSVGGAYVIYGSTIGFPSTFDSSTINGTNGFVIKGIAGSDYTGWSAEGAGDVNGDGIKDIIIGALWADPNGNKSGKAYIVFGRNTSLYAEFSLSNLNGVNGFTLNGVAANDFAGRAVSTAGDFNGDGISDILIGADGVDTQGNRAGAAYLVYGSTTPFASIIELSSLNGTNGVVLRGPGVNDKAGNALTNLGDINGDGYDDIAIGGHEGDIGGGGTNIGETYIVYGTSSLSSPFFLSSLNGTDGLKIFGIDAFDISGFAVSEAGDVNDDGLPDILIGAYRADPNGAESGESYVVFGNVNGLGTSMNLSNLDGSNGFRIDGVAAGDELGVAVNKAGDINGDGVDDIILGAHGADSNTGRSYIIYGRSQEIKGCTDPQASNYDPSATCDDGSCLCPPTLDLDGVLTAGLYEASDVLTSDGQINATSGGPVIFHAGTAIELQAGFEISGVEFTAEIENCNPTSLTEPTEEEAATLEWYDQLKTKIQQWFKE